MSISKQIITLLQERGSMSSSEIAATTAHVSSLATVKRVLNELVEKRYVEKTGIGKSTKYFLSAGYALLHTIDIDKYFLSEVDERRINANFSFDLITQTLSEVPIFSEFELANLFQFQKRFTDFRSSATSFEFLKELERLAIDLSWKSSQIEGNTYTLLETELLLKEQQEAKGKTKEEATMLLNHKLAIDFLVDNLDYFESLSVAKIENIHSLLIQNLAIPRNIRNKPVGITGTNYKPLDNQFQIRDALEQTCELVNAKSNVFEKTLLTLCLLSYIQPFVDGNKRTARIVSNGILMANNCVPISFRTVDSLDYKKAMLVFYEQNNISPMKQIFIDQVAFAGSNYF